MPIPAPDTELDPLAGQSDVEAMLGRALTSEEVDRIAGPLAKASALFRHEARQKWSEGREAVRLKSNGGRILLPQRSVIEIYSAVDDHGGGLEYRKRGQWIDTCLRSDQFATVDYSYDGAVPDAVRFAVADIAAALLLLGTEAVGAQQVTETNGPFSRTVQYASWAQGGQARLSPDDVALARSFRPIVPRVHVMQSAALEPPFRGI